MEVLQGMNVHYDVADVLLVEIPSQAGAFRKICEKLAAEHLNIDYAYCSFAPSKGSKMGVLAVVKVNDLVKAQRVLGETGNTVSRTPRRPVRRPAIRTLRGAELMPRTSKSLLPRTFQNSLPGKRNLRKVP